MPTIPAEELRRFAVGVLLAHGAQAPDASTVADTLVKSNLLGHDSHGILRLGRTVEKIRRGTLFPAAQPAVKHRHGAVAVVDGGFGLGPVTARFGAGLAIELARSHGIAAVSLSRTNHIGRLGDYAEQISAAGLIALIFAAGAGPGGSVAPHGGRERIFGTNPIAWGLPAAADRGALIADFSTSAIPEGKVAVAQSRHETLPPGVLLDREGEPSVLPDDLYAGGALLPFGGHKGSSLLLFIEVIASLLAGSAPVSSPDYSPGNPTLLVALSVDAFVAREFFDRHLEHLLQRIESSAPAAGQSRVRLPNAVELETEKRRRIEGIPLPDSIWNELHELAASTGVAMPR